MEIKDSGARREFESGCVRDIAEGKGRCDLLPLDVICMLYDNCGGEYAKSKFTSTFIHEGMFFEMLESYRLTGDVQYILDAATLMSFLYFNGLSDMVLELAKHFEAGCKKYGERNWELGMPHHCFVDSATRHYLKARRGDNDEPHRIACVWNLICLVWTKLHKPELDDFCVKAEV